MLYILFTAFVSAILDCVTNMFAVENLYPYALVLASTLFCTLYLSMHFGPLFGKQWIAEMEEFRNKNVGDMMKGSYPMKYCFAASYAGNFLRSLISAVAFQMYSPETLGAAVLFGLMDFLFLASSSHSYLWEGKPKKLIIIGLISTFITSLGSAFIYHLGALVETQPILKCSIQ